MSLEERSNFLIEVFKKHNILKDATVLEIGCGDRRNVRALQNAGWKNVDGIDKLEGTAIEDVPEKQYDVVFSMSCLFLIPPREVTKVDGFLLMKENEEVWEKIARMSKEWLITVEGETSKDSIGVFGRDYSQIFGPLGFDQIKHQTDVFNKYGVLRVFKKYGTT
jgi:hypothetical protein